MIHPDDLAVGRAASALAARRDVVAARYAASEGDDSGAVVVIGGGEDFTAYLIAQSPSWRSLHSIRLAGPDENPDILVRSLRNNQRIVDAGLEMVSVFATEGFAPDVLDLLAGQPVPYRIARAPMSLKVIDGQSVLLEGPMVDGARSLMLVRDPTTVALARRYWHRVVSRSAGAAATAEGVASTAPELTPRQRAVVALLARDASDDQAAEVLGISVRTLRADIADLKRALGVTTRFAAGLELGRRLAAADDTRG